MDSIIASMHVFDAAVLNIDVWKKFEMPVAPERTAGRNSVAGSLHNNVASFDENRSRNVLVALRSASVPIPNLLSTNMMEVPTTHALKRSAARLANRQKHGIRVRRELRAKEPVGS